MSIRAGIVPVLLLAFALPLQAGSAMARLDSIVDGNTLKVKLRGAEMKIRMHGLAVPPADATRPILQRVNQESAAFLAKYLSDGWVYLEFPDKDPVTDANGYVPAFVYRGSDATFLNEKLVSTGLAVVNRKENNKFTDRWIALQKGAEAAQNGIWGSFEGGGGERIATGVAQGIYIGVPGKRSDYPRYVSTWIIYYY